MKQYIRIAVVLSAIAPRTSATAEGRLFVFNSDGGAAAIAHIKGDVTRDVVCHELNELEGTAITDFFWCPIVGGNVFIYPTKVGERMGDNIRDWNKVHPYYREQGRAMADNLRQLVERGEDPIRILADRSRELGIRFWLTCRMNEIHEDDDRFMVLRSPFKERHPELTHGKDFHPEAIYAPQNGWSYAWDYGHPRVREHFLALFDEWLAYDIRGIELDYCRSPCLFPPGEEKAGAPLLTDFMSRLRRKADKIAAERGHPIKLAVRVPPSLKRCRAAGIDIRTWIERGLVEVVTPMDRGYFDPDPELEEFIELADGAGVIILGGIEPKVRDYRQNSKQTFAAASSFFARQADGLYLFNYDCHRLNAKSSVFGGVLQDYTPEEKNFLKRALDSRALGDHDKHYLVSHDSARRLAEEGGSRPLMCFLPVGETKVFRMSVGDDVVAAKAEKRLVSSRLVITLQDGSPSPENVVLAVNGDGIKAGRIQWQESKDLVELIVNDPPLTRGLNTIALGQSEPSDQRTVIRSIDYYIDYAATAKNASDRPAHHRPALPVLGKQQLFAYEPQSLDIFVQEPRHVAEPSDWPANLLRFQFPESLQAFDGDGKLEWEFNFEKSKHAWRVLSKADERTMGGAHKNRVMECEDTFDDKALIRRTATWVNGRIDFELRIQNRGAGRIGRIQTSMCLQRTAAPDYIDPDNDHTYLFTDAGFVPSKKLAFRPGSRMFYGSVGSRMELADGDLSVDLREPALFVVSADERFVLCYAWRDASKVFMNRSGRVRCLHSELSLTSIEPQQEVVANGVLFVNEGTLRQAYDRYLNWKRGETVDAPKR